jgi:hypothetical protein
VDTNRRRLVVLVGDGGKQLVTFPYSPLAERLCTERGQTVIQQEGGRKNETLLQPRKQTRLNVKKNGGNNGNDDENHFYPS